MARERSLAVLMCGACLAGVTDESGMLWAPSSGGRTPMTSRQGGWLTFGFGAAALAVKAQQVMAMRLLELSRSGFVAAKEFDRMVFETPLASQRSPKPRRLRRYAAMAHCCPSMR